MLDEIKHRATISVCQFLLRRSARTLRASLIRGVPVALLPSLMCRAPSGVPVALLPVVVLPIHLVG